MKALRRPVLPCTGWLCAALGVFGIVMPLFPTTPFLLAAIWAFSRSSPEMAQKIRSHRHAGKYVRDWEDHGIIPTGAKVIAVVMMTAMFGYLHFVAEAPAWVEIGAALAMGATAGFILSRPGRRAS
ncbi:YbaN family protein [Aestuariivirga sp.]|uniref:YbaN family protein n=1 Tax=Aestuariivirga sp. TaxID=2650926 RepID=UPI0025BB91BC|nr:YbaN family protein [Aestuariivirga sp.]MCA3554510.1 YbaN family protein [Aestuariivirga sp.]